MQTLYVVKCQIYTVSKGGINNFHIVLPVWWLFLPFPGDTTEACCSGVSSVIAAKVARKPSLYGSPQDTHGFFKTHPPANFLCQDTHPVWVLESRHFIFFFVLWLCEPSAFYLQNIWRILWLLAALLIHNKWGAAGSGSSLVWMRCPELRAHWRRLDGQRRRSSWMGNEQRENKQSNRRAHGWLSDTALTHTRSVFT